MRKQNGPHRRQPAHTRSCYVGDNESRWFLWYHARDDSFGPALLPGATGRVGLATSADGLTWRRGAAAAQTARDDDGREELGSEARRVSLAKAIRSSACAGLASILEQNVCCPPNPKKQDVGHVLSPNPGDWWAFDTQHVGVSDVQVRRGAPGGLLALHFLGRTSQTHEPPDSEGPSPLLSSPASGRFRLGPGFQRPRTLAPQILSSGNVRAAAGVWWMFYYGGDSALLPAPPHAAPPAPDSSAPPPKLKGVALRPGEFKLPSRPELS